MLISLLRSRRYEIISFCTGAAVLILEIVGARLIAPHFGTSTYVWTAMIGVILGSMAIGYAVGGRLADRDDAPNSLAAIILTAAVLVIGLGLSQEAVLSWLGAWQLGLRLSTFLAAILLFAPASLLLGMVSPHLAKIRITSLDTTGKHIGRLEAAGALGSIAGTFACGYWLLGIFGSRTIIVGVAVLLVFAALMASPRAMRGLGLLVVIGAVLLLATVNARPAGVVADIDTAYSRYRVIEASYGGKPIRALSNDNRGWQSAVNLSDPDALVFSYIRQFDAALERLPAARSILVIGGGTFTFPSHAAKHRPDLKVDVAEIDPGLTTISARYFQLKRTPNLHIINEDGRSYLNRTKERYDMIFFDAYASLNPPFQLTTQETMQLADARLRPGGAVVSNLIGRSDALGDRYLQSMHATVASVFPFSQTHPADLQLVPPGTERNYVLYASRSTTTMDSLTGDLATSSMPVNRQALILTDDFAPIDQLTGY